MSNAVLIKIIGSGIKLVLDKEVPFEELLEEIAVKFREKSDFFRDKPMAISFENRKLTMEEEMQIADVVMENSSIQIVMIQDEDPVLEERVNELFAKTQKNKLYATQQHRTNPVVSQDEKTDFYKGNVRSGQVIESASSITVIGDVNPGAKIVSAGNIVILGSLKGYAHAGAEGNDKCFIVALEMKPIQLQIGKYIAKSPDKEKNKRRFLKRERTTNSNKNEYEAQLAIVQDGYICIEPITKEVLNQL